MKRLIGLVLCLAMLLSFVGVSAASQASGDDEVISSVFFASDPQFYQSYTRNLFGAASITSCQSVVKRAIALASEGGHDIDAFVFGGDYTQNESSLDKKDPKNIEIFGDLNSSGNFPWHYGNDPKYTLAYINEILKSYYPETSDNAIYIQGNHDPDITDEKTFGLAPMGAYEYDDFIVYVINDADLAGPRPRCEDMGAEIAYDRTTGIPTISLIENPTAVVTKNANKLKAYLNTLIAKGDTRPVFIASHQPLYSERYSDYNGNAKLIFDVVNEAAKKLDIVFFFGHTHQKVDNIGGGLSYVARGEKLKVCNDPTLSSSDTLTYSEETLNFTYMNFGHLARYSGTNATLSSTVIDITADKLIITRYRLKNETTLAKNCVLSSYEISRKTPKSAIPSTITTTVDAKGATKTLADGETLIIKSGGVLKNATINASKGTFKIGDMTLSGIATFNENGKLTVKKGDLLKISNATDNTFLLKDTISSGDNSYSVKLFNKTSSLSENVTFEFDPIYSGDVMFRLDVSNVPTAADLNASYILED